MAQTFTVTVYPFGKALTNDLDSAEKLHNFIDSWLSLSTGGDIEIKFRTVYASESE